MRDELQTNYEALRDCSKTQFVDVIVDLVVSSCAASGFTVKDENKQKYRDVVYAWLEEPSQLFIRKDKLC